ncbi:MAG: sulfatase [Bryobacteraceae bacterium]
MTRRQLLTYLMTAAGVSAQGRRPPNVVFVLADDLGWTDLGCFGSTFYQTPHIDRLAQQGMRFTSAYAACPVCSPTRAAILTGKYPARLHVTDWIPGRVPPGLKMRPPDWTPQLRLEETTIAEVLRSAGYATASIGKWHLGDEEFYPEKQGFDVNFGGCHLGSPPNYFYPYKIPNIASGKMGEYLTDRLTDEALAFVERSRAKPFFLYLAHYAVHTPLEAKEAVAKRYQQRVRPGQSHSHPVYAAMVESMDDSVGRVLGKLDELGLAENTVVIFTSDNGGVVGRRHITSNEPLREEKATLYEGGIRVPLLIRWPGVVKPGSVCDVPVHSIDHFATLAEMAGVKAPPSDGVSLMPLLKQQGTLQREAIYWHYPHYNFHQPLIPTRPCGAIRKGDYKMIEFYEDGHTELFDIRQDIGERKGLARSMKAKVAELKRDLAAWRESVGAQMPVPTPDAYDPAKTEEWMRDRFQRQGER